MFWFSPGPRPEVHSFELNSIVYMCADNGLIFIASLFLALVYYNSPVFIPPQPTEVGAAPWDACIAAGTHPAGARPIRS